MHRRPALAPLIIATLAHTTAALTSVACAADTAAEPFPWQQTYAQVDPKGDLTWTPTPFTPVLGAAVRYIDFAAGSDSNDGSSPASAWKHHPWDEQATGTAKAGSGVHTYVFKRGVDYRGELQIAEGGTASEPIRLTSDPAWGTGEAAILGSERVTGFKHGAKLKEIPEPDQVWTVDLPFSPRCLWVVADDGATTRIPLAREPNVRESNPNDPLAEWPAYDNPKKHMDNFFTTDKGLKQHLGIDTVHLTHDAAFYKGATVWTEWGFVIGGPFATRVTAFDATQKGIAFGGKWGGTAGKILRGNRYLLEDKPQYLDDPNGEFYFKQKGGTTGGTLYLRSPGGVDPNTLRIEAARHANLILGTQADHLEISGLSFRFTNVGWNLTATPTNDPDNDPAVIRVTGPSQGLRIHHNRFVDVNKALYAKAVGTSDVIDRLAFDDNVVERADQDAVCIFDGASWGATSPKLGTVRDVEILRNHLRQTGARPTRYGSGHAINLNCVRSALIAGNVLERIYGSGIHVFGGKSSSTLQDVPWVRLLIFQNKVIDSLLTSCDWGGIETWQGGPSYVFNNISGNPHGYWNYNFISNYGKDEHANASFGHAFYLDGGYKQWLFNNIAFGQSSDLRGPLTPCSAFQEIWGHETAIFNNTAFRFLTGSRRQSPQAGRNLYLGNVFDDISWMVFRHSDPAKAGTEGNAVDAGAQQNQFALSLNAYARNVLHQTGQTGVIEATGRRLKTIQEFSQALADNHALTADAGLTVETPVLSDPARGDFTPVAGGPTDGQGVRVFVPWALPREVAEWHFRRNQQDPAVAIDNHWDFPGYKVDRQRYYLYPSWDLHGTGITAANFVNGPLEDWTTGALRLDGNGQYFTLSDAVLDAPLNYQVKNPKEKDTPPLKAMVQGADNINAEIYTGSFIIEAYLAVERSAQPGAVIIAKRDDQAGYALTLGAAGKPEFSVRVAGKDLTLAAAQVIADGAYHHVVAECDRTTGRLRLSVDGVTQDGAGVDATVSLNNTSDLHVGGTPQGRGLAATLEFLRLAQGTFAEARTSLAELRAWEFAGPQLRDFAGRPAAGKGRDAGAIEGR